VDESHCDAINHTESCLHCSHGSRVNETADLHITLFHRQKTVARKETKKKGKNIYNTVRISQHLADIRRHNLFHFILFSNKGPKGLLKVATKYNIIQCIHSYLRIHITHRPIYIRIYTTEVLRTLFRVAWASGNKEKCSPPLLRAVNISSFCCCGFLSLFQHA